MARVLGLVLLSLAGSEAFVHVRALPPRSVATYHVERSSVVHSIQMVRTARETLPCHAFPCLLNCSFSRRAVATSGRGRERPRPGHSARAARSELLRRSASTNRRPGSLAMARAWWRPRHRLGPTRSQSRRWRLLRSPFPGRRPNRAPARRRSPWKRLPWGRSSARTCVKTVGNVRLASAREPVRRVTLE